MRRLLAEVLMLVAVTFEEFALWVGGEPIAREILTRRGLMDQEVLDRFAQREDASATTRLTAGLDGPLAHNTDTKPKEDSP